jgi:uncharacterized protein
MSPIDSVSNSASGTQSFAGSFAVSVEGIDFRLLAKRGIFWPEKQTLFIADTHFGKEVTFRRHGIAAPRGSTQGTLATIAEMIAECQASRVVLLGDMFHARSAISTDIGESLDAFFAAHLPLRTTLVLGNHDRGMSKLIERWPIEIVDSGTSIDCISISHLPQPPSPSTRLLMCGHLHPAYRFSSRTDSVGKLPCFWLSHRQLVLPAIGEFTGTQVVQPRGTDQTWVIVEDQIIRV